MARRFLARGPRRGPSLRNSNIRAWAASLIGNSTANNTQVNTVIADAASYATTSANTKHAGTLLRIRGSISIVPATAGGQISIGVCIADVGETIQAPNNVAFGQDEDVLWWWQANAPTATIVIAKDIDIGAKRRLDVEQQVMLSYIFTGMGGASVFNAYLRCLVLVP